MGTRSQVSSLPEAGGDAALYVDPNVIGDIAEKCRYVFNLTSTKREVLIQKGQRQVKKFSWIEAGKETIKVYESLG